MLAVRVRTKESDTSINFGYRERGGGGDEKKTASVGLGKAAGASKCLVLSGVSLLASLSGDPTVCSTNSSRD